MLSNGTAEERTFGFRFSPVVITRSVLVTSTSSLLCFDGLLEVAVYNYLAVASHGVVGMRATIFLSCFL